MEEADVHEGWGKMKRMEKWGRVEVAGGGLGWERVTGGRGGQVRGCGIGARGRWRKRGGSDKESGMWIEEEGRGRRRREGREKRGREERSVE